MKKVIDCPFYKRESRKKIYCEGGILRFHNGELKNEYTTKYCANNACWKKCSAASSLTEYYSGGNKNE
ncbi:MAG: hypothetical protein IKA17_04540 [Clostridia bacterium]|nr:hypothetical protein [Clostridia bacterium]